MRRHRQELRPMTDMNVTNLLDTAFVLLMAFMIVAPAIKHGIELELPSVGAGNIDSEKTITVVVQKRALADGPDRVYLEERRVTYEELTDQLKAERARHPGLDVVMEADKEVTYETIAKTIGAIKSAGIENVGLATEPEDRKVARRE